MRVHAKHALRYYVARNKVPWCLVDILETTLYGINGLILLIPLLVELKYAALINGFSLYMLFAFSASVCSLVCSSLLGKGVGGYLF